MFLSIFDLLSILIEQTENALKNKKKREQRKLKKVVNQEEPKIQEKKDVPIQAVVNPPSDIVVHLTGNQDVDKQLRDLKKVNYSTWC